MLATSIRLAAASWRMACSASSPATCRRCDGRRVRSLRAGSACPHAVALLRRADGRRGGRGVHGDGGGLARRFAGWGVVAASRYLGRANLAAALRSFAAEGVWGTSPHLIPHFALHSLSGSISLALGLHGPNLGVGGGLHATAEGFLTALTWLAPGSCPASGWSSPAGLRSWSRTGAEPGCLRRRMPALALAWWPTAPDAGDPRSGSSWAGNRPRRLPRLDLAGLAESLETRGGPSPRTIATDPERAATGRAGGGGTRRRG